MANRPTEARHPSAAGLHLGPDAVVLEVLLAAQQAALGTVRPALAAIADAADVTANALRAGRKMAYAGAGSAGLMALADCLELAGTFGIAPDRTPMLFAGGAAALLHMQGGVEDDPARAAADVARAGLGQGDAVTCVSASGSTPYTLEVARLAQAGGAKVIGMANTPGSPLLEKADISILLDSGPEVVAGSTRMGAATAQKVALNMLSVLVGIRLGHVHDGYMVNLVADNAKLIDRAARIVAAVAGCDLNAAQDALGQVSGAVKPAILVARGASPEQADAMLSGSGGHLAPAMADFAQQ